MIYLKNKSYTIHSLYIAHLSNRKSRNTALSSEVHCSTSKDIKHPYLQETGTPKWLTVFASKPIQCHHFRKVVVSCLFSGRGVCTLYQYECKHSQATFQCRQKHSKNNELNSLFVLAFRSGGRGNAVTGRLTSNIFTRKYGLFSPSNITVSCFKSYKLRLL